MSWVETPARIVITDIELGVGSFRKAVKGTLIDEKGRETAVAVKSFLPETRDEVGI